MDKFLLEAVVLSDVLYLLDLAFIYSATEKYEPVNAKWTTERCAVCRWVEDWDYNKIIICNRYFDWA